MLGPVFVFPQLGRSRLEFEIPRDPALVNQLFFTQSLHVTDLAWPPTTWRFTNLLRERVR